MRDNARERILRYPVDTATFPTRGGRLHVTLLELDPLEVLFLLVFLVSGLAQAFSGATPGSIDALMPQTFRVIWLLLLTLGAATALCGVFWPAKKSDGLLIESVGLAWVGVSVMLYGVALAIASMVYLDNPGGALLAGPLTFVLGVAFFWRHRRLQRLIEWMKAT